MSAIKSFLKTVAAVLLFLPFVACEKPAGPGGKATVTGKVYAYDFDNTQRYLLSKGYSSGDKVFICYGNSTAIGNDVVTSSDGSFEFRYLNKGHYKVFVNSLDTSIKVKGNDTEFPVIKEFDITGTSQEITLEDFIINK
jgi:hypothetical protein